MNAETYDWLKRLPWWLLLVLGDLQESGDAYVGEMLIPVVSGFMSLFLPVLILLAFPELRSWWLAGIGIGVFFYLVCGILAFFSYEGKNFGPWQYRGAW